MLVYHNQPKLEVMSVGAYLPTKLSSKLAIREGSHHRPKGLVVGKGQACIWADHHRTRQIPRYVDR